MIAFSLRSLTTAGVNTVGDLRRQVQGSPHPRDTVLRRLQTHLQVVRSTGPYWSSRAAEVRTIVDQLGRPPTFFITLTADYLGWPDLYAYILGRDQPVNLVEELPTREERLHLLDRHGRAAASFVYRKLSLAFDRLLVLSLGVTDRVFRVEWQAGGRAHLHGFIWASDAPTSLDSGRI